MAQLELAVLFVVVAGLWSAVSWKIALHNRRLPVEIIRRRFEQENKNHHQWASDYSEQFYNYIMEKKL